MKAWLGLGLLGAVITFVDSAQTDDMPFWLAIGGSIYAGLIWIIVVWRTGLTPAGAWKRLNEPPREDL